MLFALLVLLLPVVGSQPNAPPVQEPAGRFILVARVYHDLNRSGTHQPREPMLSGWTFQLYDHNSQPVAYAVSDRFGLVIFTGLKRGIYTLCEQPLPGWLNTQPRQLNPAFGNQPCYTRRVASFTNPIMNFGNDRLSFGINLDKWASQLVIKEGDSVRFNFRINLTGEVPLNAIKLFDSQCFSISFDGGDVNTNGILEAGENWLYHCDVTLTQDMLNTARTIGLTPTGGWVQDVATATVTVLHPPYITLSLQMPSEIIAGVTQGMGITVMNNLGYWLNEVTVTSANHPECNFTVPRALGPTGIVSSEWQSNCEINATDDFTFDLAATGKVVDSNLTSLGLVVFGSTAPLIDVIHPAIQLSKNPVSVAPDGNVVFGFLVANQGDVPLYNVIISDPLASNCNRTYSELGPQGSLTNVQTYECDVIATETFANIAFVTASTIGGYSVSNEALAYVTIQHPAISLDKGIISIGTDGMVTYNFVVKNTGDSDLSSITVDDPLVPACSQSHTALPGSHSSAAEWHYTCTAVATTSFTNTATVTALAENGAIVTATDSVEVVVDHPASIGIYKNVVAISADGTVTYEVRVNNTGRTYLYNIQIDDPLVPACNGATDHLYLGGTNSTYGYQCSAVATASFTNVVNVTAHSDTGIPVSATASAEVTIQHPAISLDKGIISIGTDGMVTYNFVVKNTGDSDLSSITVDDPLVPACSQTGGSLPASGSSAAEWHYTCSAVAATNFTNTATVTALAENGATVTATDSVEVVVSHPAIGIYKNVLSIGADGTVTYEVRVNNTGRTYLYNIQIDDPLVPACNGATDHLYLGGTNSTYGYQCSAVATASFTNVVNVTAHSDTGIPVSASASAEVTIQHPAIDVTKQVISATPDGWITYAVNVYNTGDVHLFNITLTDPLVPACNWSIAVLTMGGSSSAAGYQCVAQATGDFTNVIQVTGSTDRGLVVTDSASVAVHIPRASLSISKQFVSFDPQTATAFFRIEVYNTGELNLVNVTVSDPLAPDCSRSISNGQPGTLSRYTCFVAGVTCPFTNEATATAQTETGYPLTAVAQAEVTVPQS
ncbi:MAG TPA: hypothetical protein PLQ56_13050 [Aggregatilineales bacterium]|nr:hypothetical protein [Aggregatilineales bacterium]